jgi:hypothetical protein
MSANHNIPVIDACASGLDGRKKKKKKKGWGAGHVIRWCLFSFFAFSSTSKIGTTPSFPHLCAFASLRETNLARAFWEGGS